MAARSRRTARGGGEGSPATATVSRPALLDEGDDARFRDLLYSIFAFSSRLQAVRSRFGAFIGLSPTQYMVLIAVAQHAGDRPGIAQIAEHLHLSGAFVTIEVNKLVKAGLVEKAAHGADKRRVILEASPEGLERLSRLAAFQRPVNDALFASLDAKDFATLHRLMGRLLVDADSAIALSNYVEGQLVGSPDSAKA